MHEMERIANETDHTLFLISNQQEYRKISDQLYVFINHIGTPRNKNDLDKMKQHMSSPLLQDETLAISFWAKLYYYRAHHLYSDTILDFENSYAISLKMLHLMESRPKITNEHMYGFLQVLNYVLLSCIETRRYDLLEPYLKKLRELPKIYPNATTRRAQISIFETGYNAEIIRAIKTGDFESAVKVAEIISKGLEKYNSNMPDLSRLLLCLNISKAFFGAGNYKSALVWLNKILQNDLNLGENQVAFTRIFNLIIHLEIQNDEVLPYIVKSAQRALLKKNRLYKVENAILDFVKTYTRMDTRNEITNAFARLKTELLLLEKDPYEKIAFEEFNYIDWAESKIQSRKLGEIVKERLKKETGGRGSAVYD